jgi:hypothetical protein
MHTYTDVVTARGASEGSLVTAPPRGASQVGHPAAETPSVTSDPQDLDLDHDPHVEYDRHDRIDGERIMRGEKFYEDRPEALPEGYTVGVLSTPGPLANKESRYESSRSSPGLSSFGDGEEGPSSSGTQVLPTGPLEDDASEKGIELPPTREYAPTRSDYADGVRLPVSPGSDTVIYKRDTPRIGRDGSLDLRRRNSPPRHESSPPRHESPKSSGQAW